MACSAVVVVMAWHWLAAAAPADGGGAGAAPSPGYLDVEVTDLRSDQGMVRVRVYSAGEGFPGKEDRAARVVVVAVKNRRAQVEIKDLPPGEYAVAAHHDENSNGRLDSYFFGMPKEGVGTSNNPRPRFGPPRFQDARVVLGAQPLRVHIKMVYLL